MTIHRIAVIGAGTMGAGIAQVAAVAGMSVRITDADASTAERALERIRTTLAGGVARGKIRADGAEAALGRIAAVPTMEVAAADSQLIVEAIVEDIEIKRRLFADLDRLAPADAILATNTSSLSVARIAEATHRPSRVLGMHFFNPVHIMELVELVQHAGTSVDVIESVRNVVVAMKKTPIVVRDMPGFASSRLGVALGLEAMRMVEEGVATAADIDTAMVLGYGHPMGPLRVTDLVGLDVRLRIAEYLHQELGGSHFKPPEILRQKVTTGELGKKSGKGFYDWPTGKV